MPPEPSKNAQPSKRIPVEVDVLEDVIGRIYKAGLLLNGRLDGQQLHERITAAVAELDEAVHSIQSLALGSRGDPTDLDHLLVQVSKSADDVVVLAEVQRNNGPGHFLDQAARHLHQAHMALVEAREGSQED